MCTRIHRRDMGSGATALRFAGWDRSGFRDDPVAHRDSHPVTVHYRLRLIVISQIVAGNAHVRTCERILKPRDLHSREVLDQSQQARAEPTIGRRTAAAGNPEALRITAPRR